ncbi:MAG: hypothetical protein U1F53_08755 [Burkholderiaceae bacterium]
MAMMCFVASAGRRSAGALFGALAIAAGAAHAAGQEAVQDAVQALWSQTLGGTGVGVNAQNYEPVYDDYDALAADDFAVPAGEVWVVERVEVVGNHYDGVGPLSSMNVAFHRDDPQRPGKPGRLLRSLLEQPARLVVYGTGSYDVTLTEPVRLPAGRYWLALQGNADFVDAGQWAWETSHAQQGKPGVWKNPGDAFGTGCRAYRRQQRCIGDIGQGPDFMFVLHGRRRPP